MEKKKKIILIIVIVFGASFPFWISPLVESIQYDFRYGDGIIKANLCDVDKVNMTSKFRSCAGHPYPRSQDPMSTSSEKHYIALKYQYFEDAAVDVKLYAIWDGTIEAITNDTGTIQVGKQIHLSSAGWTAVYMHVDPLPSLQIGQRVMAGELIGYCDVPYPPMNYTSFDICIHRHRAFSDPGYSYFELMPDDIFAPWAARGATKAALVIPADVRTKNPCQTGCTDNLLCYNVDPANWITLA
ncbi:MAG: hypothetical protein RBG13Loki_4081 [Promethearchaeota archaeon CR_4]|nr:MAG: hypothetical protein RBG13Loki_4081 [Candidatus Lokiarchaeota archaeon CR_4]